ncbi:MAG: type 1 glutamine amidotransferase [Bacteroidota bacterium]
MDLTKLSFLPDALPRRPLIGITGPSQGGNWFWWATAGAVWRAGGKPVYLTPTRKDHPKDQLDGLILSGGGDIDPRIYQRDEVLTAYLSKEESNGLELKERDRLELQLYQMALLAKIPVLGICRGAQLINVAQGGSLHQNIQSFYPETEVPRGIWPIKQIHLKPGGVLGALFSGPTLKVNALHLQAMDRLGKGISVLAEESNGLIQAIALGEGIHPLVWGIQWHPEFLPFSSSQQSLFHVFVRTAGKGIKKRSLMLP